MARKWCRAKRWGPSIRILPWCWVATVRCYRRPALWPTNMFLSWGSIWVRWDSLPKCPLSEMYSTLEAVDVGHCPVEERSVLDCTLFRGGDALAHHFALNDVVVNKSAISRLVDFDLLIDGVFVFNYKADGVIIATPTGSTAYSLAAGGPVMMPLVESFVVTPVCPHSLTHRPLVVTDKAQIELRVETGAEEAFLSIDGQIGVPVKQGDRVLCRRAEHTVRLMRVRRTFFDVLRNKLRWGQR